MAIFSNIQHLINGVDIDTLLSKIEDLTRELKQVKADASKQKSSLTSKLERVQKKNETLVEDLTRETNKCHIVESKLAQSEASLVALEKENVELSKTGEKYKTDVQKLSESNSSLNGKNLSLYNKVAKLEQQKQTLEDEINAQKAEISSLAASKEKLKSRLKNETQLLDEAKALVEALNDEKNQLSSVIKTKSEEYAVKLAEVESLKTHNTGLIRDCDDRSLRIADLEKEIKEYQSTIKSLTCDNDGFKKTCENLSNENDDLRNKYTELTESYSRLNTEYEGVKAENESIRGEINSQKSSIDQVNAENSKLSDELKTAKNDCLIVQERLTSSENECESLQIQKLNSEKEEIMPYMYLIEAKKEEEAKELAFNSAKNDLDILIGNAQRVLSSFVHNETSEQLSSIIAIAQKQLDSASDISILEETNGKLRESIKQIQLKEKELIEEEERQREEERKRLEESQGEEESNHIEEEIFDDESLPYVFDNELVPADKLSIPEVYDVKEEKTINARDFFSQNENELILWRRNLQEEYLLGKSRFICPECKQPVKISGHKLQRGRVCYFAHFKDSDDCPYKTGTNRTKEEIERLKYSLVQESERHKRLKAAIASALDGVKSKEMGVTNVECEKRISSDIPYLNWRRPDIYAEYNGLKFVFELQLSTTFVSVIVDRDIFYRLNDYNIIWVFNFEDNQEYVNLHNLMCKDIYYANKRNVFIFDSEAERESVISGELVLKCRWLDENGVWSNDEFVTLDMFKYDNENHKPYIIDADTAYLAKYPEYAERRRSLEHSREYLLKALMERQRLEIQIEENKAIERNNIQKELLKGNESVERFVSGTKYGYQYNGITIIPAKYTSAEIIGEEGYAKVGFNRKIGLVRKDGTEIVPVEYKNVNVINSQHGIILASYKHVQLFLANDSFCLYQDFDEKKQNIVREQDNEKIKYILQTSTYNYSYTQSYYGNHPICHKSFAGYNKNELFSFIEDKDFCILWVNNKTYLLSNNQLSMIEGRYSEIKSIGIDLVFIARNLENNQWGVIDFHGNVIVDFMYEELIPTGSEYLIIKDSTDSIKLGVIDYQGREFITPQFEALIYLNSEHFAFRENGLWGVCDRTATVLHAPEYTYICGSPLGGLRASLLESYDKKWSINNSVPLYHDENVKLLLLSDKGDITYSEKCCGKYIVRHSGDLYSILSSEGILKENYTLSYVEFITETDAIIKDIDYRSGLFLDGRCIYFDGCAAIEGLAENVFIYTNNSGKKALGNNEGPKSDYLYSEIAKIDSNHFVAIQSPTWGYTVSGWGNIPVKKVIINSNAEKISCDFTEIKEFVNGYAEATIDERHGIIDIDGHMQENIVTTYGNYRLFEKFENYYFKNEDNEQVSEEYQKINHLDSLFFSVQKRGETNVKIYSLGTQELTTGSFHNVYHLCSDMFVVEESYGFGYGSQRVKKLYKGLNALYPENYQEIKTLENGYIALQKNNTLHQLNKWILLRNDGSKLSELEYDSVIEASSEYITVIINGFKGLVDKNGEKNIEKENPKFGTIIIHCFEDFGLEDTEGNTIIPLSDHFSSIDYLDSSIISVCKNKTWALYTINGQQLTDFKFASIRFESEGKYCVTEGNIVGHIDSDGNYIESQLITTKDGNNIFVIMEKYGLKDFNGQIVISPDYCSIEYLERGLLAVKNEINTAIFRTNGDVLTEFIYSEIKCLENGNIIGTRNNQSGGIDDAGNEVAEIKHFNGGYLKMSFGDYSIMNDSDETIIPVGYSKIELLEDDSLFVLWKNNKATIANLSNEKTDSMFDSVKSVGYGFYVVSRTIPKRIRVRKTGYGYYGTPYTYYVSKDVQETKFGVIDKKLKIVIPCKYQTMSDFNEERNLIATNSKGEKNTISLKNLQKRSTKVFELEEGKEYSAKVKAFMAIGIIVKIQDSTYVIHKRYLYKDKNNFTKGEPISVTFLGVDKYEHPTWSTKELPKAEEEKDVELDENL